MTTFDLSAIRITENKLPPRFVFYGTDGIGKSTFVAGAPSPVTIPTIDGEPVPGAAAFPVVTEFPHVLDALRALARGGHTHRTVILDSLDAIERMIHAWTAREKGKENIEDLPYGRGFTFALEHWNTMLTALDYLRSRGMTVILVAHSEIKRFDSPDSEPYDRYQLKLHKSASALIREWADVVGFASREVIIQKTDAGFNKEVTRGVGTGKRLLYLDERPSHHAKNRYALPPKIELSWNALREALAPAFAKLTNTTETTELTEEAVNA